MRRIPIALSTSAALIIAAAPAAQAMPLTGDQALAAPPPPALLVQATNAMLRPSDVATLLGTRAGRGSRTGFINPPGGQDPLPVCVFGPEYRVLAIPASGAVGYLSSTDGMQQDAYQYRDAAAAAHAWAAVSRGILADCRGTHALGDGRTTTVTVTRVAGPAGSPEGWSVLSTGDQSQYSLLQLVGDTIQMTSTTAQYSQTAARKAKAAVALSVSLADRWPSRATAPVTQDPVLTKAERTMLTPADVPASLPVASAASGGWSSFSGVIPGASPGSCADDVQFERARQSFETDLGSGGDLFSSTGTLIHTVDVYKDPSAAKRVWKSVRQVLLDCNQKTPASLWETDAVRQVRTGWSGLEINGVPGIWLRSVDTYPASPGSTCSTADGKQGPCPSFSTGQYAITLLVGDSIQTLTYGRTRTGIGHVKVDQLVVNELAEQLAQRWVDETAHADTPETEAILKLFKDLNAIPRCSKNEGPVSSYLLSWAADHGLAATKDALNNVLVKVPGSTGRENEPPLALQAHMDMVCAKTPDSTHDFATDPIEYVRDGDWLHANKTTLGADDGIGIAIAMYLSTEPGISRPPLELVFTTDEEIDMTGAAGLSPTALTAKRYMNIDWETEGSIALGSAGGIKRDISMPLTFSGLDDGWEIVQIDVTGLRGGHSGLMAGKGRANANVAMADVLKAVGPSRLASFDGGAADNSFAPSARAVIAVPPGGLASLTSDVAGVEAALRKQYPDEKNLSITVTHPANAPTGFATAEQTASLVTLLLDIPQDVYEWSTDFPGLPETSNNIGMIRTTDNGVLIKTFHRSFNPAKLQAFTELVARAVEQAGGSSHVRSAFPTWPPNPQSTLYATAQRAFESALGAPLKTVVVHAGLETGFVAEKYPGMDIVSVGPTLVDVHTPDERLNVPSIQRLVTFLREMLREV